MGDSKIISRQVEGGAWQAHYEDGAPNEFGQGATQAEAEKNLQERQFHAAASLGNTAEPPAGTIGSRQEHAGTMNHAVAHKTDRIVTKKLQAPTNQKVNGQDKTVSWVAYRENAPDIQSYGENEQGARVQFLTDERDRQNKPKAVDPTVKTVPDKPAAPVNADDVTHTGDAAQAVVDATTK